MIDIKTKFIEQAAIDGDLHLYQPVFLTSGCCDPAWSSPKQLRALGLKYMRTSQQCSHWGWNYPLTKQENRFIAEDYMDSAYGCWSLSYVVLYKSKKWLFPSLEICFDSIHRPFSKNSYNTLYDSSKEGHKQAVKLSRELELRLRNRGRYTVIVLQNAEIDRHYVGILIPFALAFQLGGYWAYKGWLQDTLVL